jgi:hypothetical protein
VRRLLALVVAGGVLGACAAPPKPPPDPPVEPEGRHVTYVALGDVLSATPDTGVGDGVAGWPRLVLRGVLPRETTLTVLATATARTADVLDRQVPQAERVLAAATGDALVASVAVGLTDLAGGASADGAAATVGRIVQRLRSAGAAVVLVPIPDGKVLGPYADTPGVAAFDAALARLGATVVDVAALSTVKLFGPDERITPDGAARIAAVVGPALRTAAGR